MILSRWILLAVFGAAVAAPAAYAQSSDADERPSVFSQLFGRRDQAPVPPSGMQGDDSELVIRLQRAEERVRQLTGMVEQLEYRNQQLENQLRQVQGNAPPPRGPSQATLPPVTPQQPMAPQAAPPLPPPGPAETGPSNRRGDAFDPNANPNAVGAPRTLGNPNQVAGPPPAMPPQAGPPPGPRPLNQPMDLSPNAAAPNLPPPGPGPGENQPPVGPQATLPSSASARDEYDLAYGYILRRDYALAEQSFRAFLQRHGEDRNVPLASYWLGESLFAQKKHNDAAEIFLDIYNKYPNTQRAPDALLRLGQSLAALGKQDAACASLGAVLSKYPKASPTVKKNVEEEQKRLRC